MFPSKVVACVTTYWSEKSMSDRHEIQCKCTHNFCHVFFPSSFSWTELKLYVFGYLCFCSKEFRFENICCTTPKSPRIINMDDIKDSRHTLHYTMVRSFGYDMLDIDNRTLIVIPNLTNMITSLLLSLIEFVLKSTHLHLSRIGRICSMIFNTSLLIEAKI